MKNLLRLTLVIVMLSATTLIKAQVPVLSSYPAADSAVLFLDFDGHTVENTAWNIGDPIVCAGSNLDNTKITEIFNRVAEDYRPFKINVTTDSTKYHAAQIDRRMRVIITISSSWYGSAGGVAWTGSFNWGDGTPCFVFSALLNYNTKNISEAVAHEAGHTLGLYHQAVYNSGCGSPSSPYNYGTGSGEIGWAPIMGVGYYQNFTIWHNGPNPYGCTNYQNELEILTTMTGFGYRPDDHSASFGSATNASFVSNQFNVNGIVERNTDQDMIRFTQPALGRFLLSAVPYNVGTGNSGSNLDLQVTLYNGSQTQLNVYNPGTLLSSVIDTTLNPGTYYLRIEGRGNVYAPNYASLGSYSLQANFMAGALPLHRLELRGQLNGDLHQLNWFIEADEVLIRQVLEVSTDGRNFQPVTEPATALRAYAYRPNISGTAQYRLHATFDNGREYYSNIVTLRKPGSNPRPRIINTVVNSNAVEISSPGSNYTYSVYDLSGKILVQGKLETGSNNISVPGVTGGMYMIRFTNGAEQWIDKFIKQ